MIGAEMDLTRAFSKLDKITVAAETMVRPAAQAAAQVFYDEVRARAPVSDGAHFFYGTHQRYFFKAGNLRDSVYQVFSKRNSNATKATYHIAWNHRKAPYGYMVEFGTSHSAAHPFLRPAYDAALARAVVAVKVRLAVDVKKAVS